MTLHHLTKKLLSAKPVIGRDRDESIEKIVRGYLTGRAEWLKGQSSYVKDAYPEFYNAIDRAFHLTPETLEEKFHAIRLAHHKLYKSPEDFWAAVLKEFAEVAEKHFNNQPSVRTVNCSVQPPQSDGTY